jgi:DNA-binding response OmpR family regulator
VTKFVKRGGSHNPTHISQNAPHGLVYIAGMQGAPHILIVDDHREIRDLVSRALTKEGFRVSTAADGRAMQKVLADGRIDLILLDLMLPGEDGLSLCRTLRAESSVPIIMLTAKGEEVDRVIGLEMGADDYLSKPFGSRELIARIKAVLRRSQEKVSKGDFEHSTLDPPGEPHTHFHEHGRLKHSHPHVPDMHHLHRHERWRWLSLFRSGGQEHQKRD